MLNKILFLGLLFELLASASFASSLLEVKGKVSTSMPDFDLARVTIEQTIYCVEGWGDGARLCGSKSTTAKVQPDGSFSLDKIVGEKRNWNVGYYAVYFDGKLAFRSMYNYTLSENGNRRLIHDFLKSFTIFKLPSYSISVRTDSEDSYEKWIQTENKGGPAGYRFLIQKNSGKDPYSDLLPKHEFSVALKQNITPIGERLFALPGNLKESMDNYSVRLLVNSGYAGGLESRSMVNALIPLNSPNLMDQLSSVYLETKLINRSFEGLWLGKPAVDFVEPQTGKLLIYSEPTLIVTANCLSSKLEGHVDLFYKTNPQLNKRLPLMGSCFNSGAEFDLTYKAYAYPAHRNQTYDLRGRFFVTYISHNDAEFELLDLSNQVRQPSYSSFQRCQDVTRNELGYMTCK